MSLESSVSFWDAISFWFITGGVILAFVGGVASIMFRRYNRQLVVLTETHNREVQAANEKAIAEANARAAEATLLTAQLEKAVAGRRLIPDQQKLVAKKCESLAGREVWVGSYTGDAEAMKLGLQIEAALKLAKIRVTNKLGLAGAMTEVTTGVRVTGPKSDEYTVRTLADALSSGGNLATDWRFTSEGPAAPPAALRNVTTVFVGLKPLEKSNGA